MYLRAVKKLVYVQLHKSIVAIISRSGIDLDVPLGYSCRNGKTRDAGTLKLRIAMCTILGKFKQK